MIQKKVSFSLRLPLIITLFLGLVLSVGDPLLNRFLSFSSMTYTPDLMVSRFAAVAAKYASLLILPLALALTAGSASSKKPYGAIGVWAVIALSLQVLSAVFYTVVGRFVQPEQGSFLFNAAMFLGSAVPGTSAFIYFFGGWVPLTFVFFATDFLCFVPNLLVLLMAFRAKARTAAPAVPPAVPQPSEPARCSACGGPLREDQRFCPLCGTPRNG